MSAVWIVALLCSVFTVCFIALFYIRFMRLERRIERVAAALSGKKTKRQVSRSLSKVYGFINEGMIRENDIIVYKAAELLKTAYAEGMLRSDEPIRLMGIVVKAIHAGRYNAAAALLNTFRPMLLQLPAQHFPVIAEQFVLIAVVAFRARQHFFISRIADYVFFILQNKSLVKANASHIFDILRVLKVLGLLALRRKDFSLFREICKCWSENLLTYEEHEVTQAVLQVWTAWLHRIVKVENQDMFDLMVEGTWQLFRAGRLTDEDINYLVLEWHKQAGIACLNPYNPLAVGILRFMLQLAEAKADLSLWTLIIRQTAQVIKTAIVQRSFRDAFCVFVPLLDAGRKLFIMEVKFGEYSDGFRQQVLFQILKECVMLVAYVARQDYTVLQGECIRQLRAWWIEIPEYSGRRKTISKFCQLLFAYWTKTHHRQAKKERTANDPLLEPQFLTEREKELFFFLRSY